MTYPSSFITPGLCTRCGQPTNGPERWRMLCEACSRRIMLDEGILIAAPDTVEAERVLEL